MTNKHPVATWKKGCIPWNKGKKGLQIAWSKGLTKETDERVKKHSEKMKIIPHTKEWNEKVKFSMSKAIKEGRFNPLEGKNIKPNKKETILINLLNEILPNRYKYVGDGKFWIENYNPDYININGGENGNDE